MRKHIILKMKKVTMFRIAKFYICRRALHQFRSIEACIFSVGCNSFMILSMLNDYYSKDPGRPVKLAVEGSGFIFCGYVASTIGSLVARPIGDKIDNIIAAENEPKRSGVLPKPKRKDAQPRS